MLHFGRTAKLTLHRANNLQASGPATAETLRELLNVSQLAFAPGESLATVERENITSIYLAPTMIARRGSW